MLHETAADACSHADIQYAFRFAGGAKPCFAQRTEVAVVADNDGRFETGFQQRAKGNAGQLHIRRHDDESPIGIDYTRHRDADGGQIVGTDSALADHVVHAFFDGRDLLLGPGVARRGATLATDDFARFTHQGCLHFRAADIHTQI